MSKLPRGVFRHMLEYKFPNEFHFRYSDPCVPIEKQQDRHFPAIDKLDYNNYLVAVNEIPRFRYHFTLQDGASCGSEGSGNNWTSIQIS